MTRLRWFPVLFRPYLGLGTSKEKKRNMSMAQLKTLVFSFFLTRCFSPLASRLCTPLTKILACHVQNIISFSVDVALCIPFPESIITFSSSIFISSQTLISQS